MPKSRNLNNDWENGNYTILIQQSVKSAGEFVDFWNFYMEVPDKAAENGKKEVNIYFNRFEGNFHIEDKSGPILCGELKKKAEENLLKVAERYRPLLAGKDVKAYLFPSFYE